MRLMMTVCMFASLLPFLTLNTAEAAPPGAVMIINVAGLDLRSNTGAAVAIGRISNAAATYCQGTSDLRDMGLYAETTRCRREMTAKAVRKLDAPSVTALYGGGVGARLASR